MKSVPKWQYDEMKPCGVDFTDVEEVVAYDLMHRKFRDYAKSSEAIIVLNATFLIYCRYIMRHGKKARKGDHTTYNSG